MRQLIGFSVALAAVFGACQCQVHYVPAQILIPTINGTYLLTNQTLVNVSNHAPAFNSRPTSFQNNSSYALPNWNYSVPYNGTRDGHLILGAIQTYDRLLFNQEYFYPRRWYSYREKTVKYPKDLPAGYSRHETISAIRVYNKFYDGNTARAAIEEGGDREAVRKDSAEVNMGQRVQIPGADIWTLGDKYEEDKYE
ncbi:hypothetical protein NQ318_022145 [Aromia moschata]|uniref:Uncharacterized protein n=1 Tax=Aromia moschata TaxID=1265417 RepID=A0AAV8Z5S2_9CUCU|nr:hypothetical protein NQ318_022145 [Aromia moschata]